MADFTITEPLALDYVKTYLRVDGNAEDTLITAFISAARDFAERHENRLLVARTVTDVAGTDFFTPSETEKAAMLMFIGHLYEHREAVIIGETAVEIPLGATRLLDLYRVYSV